MASPVICRFAPDGVNFELVRLDADYGVAEIRSLPARLDATYDVVWEGCAEGLKRTSANSPARWWTFSPGFDKLAIVITTPEGDRAAGYVDLVTGDMVNCSVTPDTTAYSADVPNDDDPYFLADGRLVFEHGRGDSEVLVATPPCTSPPQPVTRLSLPEQEDEETGRIALSEDGWPLEPFHPSWLVHGNNVGPTGQMDAASRWGGYPYRSDWSITSWVTPTTIADCCISYPFTAEDPDPPQITPRTDQELGPVIYSQSQDKLIFPAVRSPGDDPTVYAVGIDGGEPQQVGVITGTGQGIILPLKFDWIRHP